MLRVVAENVFQGKEQLSYTFYFYKKITNLEIFGS